MLMTAHAPRTAACDIQPLLHNVGRGLRVLAEVTLNDTNVTCTDMAALEAKGVEVLSDCR